MFLKLLMLIRQVPLRSVLVITIAIFVQRFQVSGFSQLSIDIKNIAILNINEVNYHCIIFGMSENGTMNLSKNANLSKKSGPL